MNLQSISELTILNYAFKELVEKWASKHEKMLTGDNVAKDLCMKYHVQLNELKERIVYLETLETAKNYRAVKTDRTARQAKIKLVKAG